MKKHLNPFYTLFIFLILNACTKETSLVFNQADWASEDQYVTNTNFEGIINDTTVLPLSGVIIKAGDKADTTDATGVFSIDSATVSKNNALLSISKPGYFTCVKTRRIIDGVGNEMKVQLIERKLSGTFNSDQGDTVKLGSDFEVIFPAKGIIQTSDGGEYSGKVNVFFYYLDPSNPKSIFQMPGELKGIINSGVEKPLVSYGIAKVEIEDDAGNRLNLAKGKQAKFIFPSSDKNPPIISLWSFSEKFGRWLEQGTAKLVKEKYEATVNYLSPWSCSSAN